MEDPDATPDVDQEFGKLLGQIQAQAQQATAATDSLAALLTRFRAGLIIGGFQPEDATEMARDYFGAMLDGLRSSTEDA